MVSRSRKACDMQQRVFCQAFAGKKCKTLYRKNSELIQELWMLNQTIAYGSMKNLIP